MVIIRHKNGQIRIDSTGAIRAMIKRQFLPGTFSTVIAARVGIAHAGYRERAAQFQ